MKCEHQNYYPMRLHCIFLNTRYNFPFEVLVVYFLHHMSGFGLCRMCIYQSTPVILRTAEIKEEDLVFALGSY